MTIPRERNGALANYGINIIEDASIPEGTIYLVPKLQIIRVVNKLTGTVTEYIEWNPKAGAVITNVGSQESGQESK